MTTPSTGAIERALNNSLQDSDIETDSIHDYNHRTIGETVSKVITLTANGGSESLDCFTVTGCVEILKLYGQITTADTLTNLTGAYFNMWDGTLATAITKNDGVLSGMAIGTTFLKNAAVDAKGKPMPLKDGLEMAQKKIRKDYSMCLPDDVVVEIVKELVAERMPVAKPIEFPVLPLELPVVEK